MGIYIFNTKFLVEQLARDARATLRGEGKFHGRVARLGGLDAIELEILRGGG
jgi:ADP-glucose pyrophosphorylase